MELKPKVVQFKCIIPELHIQMQSITNWDRTLQEQFNEATGAGWGWGEDSRSSRGSSRTSRRQQEQHRQGAAGAAGAAAGAATGETDSSHASCLLFCLFATSTDLKIESYDFHYPATDDSNEPRQRFVQHLSSMCTDCRPFHGSGSKFKERPDGIILLLTTFITDQRVLWWLGPPLRH